VEREQRLIGPVSGSGRRGDLARALAVATFRSVTAGLDLAMTLGSEVSLRSSCATPGDLIVSIAHEPFELAGWPDHKP
jgi:hypothetical protein